MAMLGPKNPLVKDQNGWMGFLNIVNWAQNWNVVVQNGKVVVRSWSRNAKSGSRIFASRPKIAMLVPTRPIAISRLLRANSDLPTDWPTNACTGLKVAMSGPNMAEWWPYKTVRVPYNQDWAHKAQVRAQRDRVEAQKVWMAKWVSKMPCLRVRIIKWELNMAIDGQTGLNLIMLGPNMTILWPL